MSGALVELVLDPLTVSFMGSHLELVERLERRAPGSIRRRYHADASASSCGLDVVEDRAAAAVGGVGAVGERALDGRGAHARAARRPRRRRARRPPSRGGHATEQDRVRVRVRPAEPRAARAPRLVDLDARARAGRSRAGEEVVDGLGALAAGPGRADARAEREQRRLQVAARRLGAGRRAEVAADRRLRADLVVADVPRRRSRAAPAPRRRGARPETVAPIRERAVLAAEPVQPGAGEQERALRAQAAHAQLRHEDRPAGDDRHALAVAEGRTASSGTTGRGRRPCERQVADFMADATRAAIRTACRDERPSKSRATLLAARWSRRSQSSRTPSVEPAYLPDRGLATALFLVAHAREAAPARGRGRRRQDRGGEGARRRSGARLIRLQCYEGLDVAHAVYEWNYPRQLVHIRAAQEGTVTEDELFGPEFLIRRPLLDAIESARPGRAADRRDRPRRRRVRGVPARGALGLPDHDPGDRDRPRDAPADRRPDLEPHARAARRAQAALPLPLDRAPVARARDRDRQAARARGLRSGSPRRRPRSCRGCAGSTSPSRPGVAETIDWAQALAALGHEELDAAVVEETLGVGAQVPRGPARRAGRRSRASSRRRAPQEARRLASARELTPDASSATSSPSAACCARRGSRSGRAGSPTR